jgi:phosphoribosylformylglycinamidine (FGAM) synthase PurS component
MPRFAIQVDIVHLPGVADPAGATVERALPSLGYTNVTDLKICERILANPVIEDYSVAVHELIAP